MSVSPEDRTILVYDQTDTDIEKCAQRIAEFTSIYNLVIQKKEIYEWSIEPVSRWSIEPVSRSHKHIFFVSMETERLHESLVAKLKSYKHNKVLVLLIYSANDGNGENYANVYGARDAIHDLWKSAKPVVNGKVVIVEQTKNTNQSTEAGDGLDVSTWWPYVLVFLADRRKGNARLKHEIGLFYQVNRERYVEYKWFENQRRFLEEELHIKCLLSDGSVEDDEHYASRSACVAIFLAKPHGDQLEDSPKSLVKTVNTFSSKVRLYAEKLNQSFVTMMTGHYELTMYGKDMMAHWNGILNDLGIVNLRPRVDPIFYSKRGRLINYRAFHGEENRVPTQRHTPGGGQSNDLKGVCFMLRKHVNR